MPVEYDPALILLSVVIAMQGGYVSLSLARRVARAAGPRRKALLAASAPAVVRCVRAAVFIADASRPRGDRS